MLQRLRDWFLPPGHNLSAESREFVSSLANSQVWLLAVGLRGTPAAPTYLSEPGAIEAMAAYQKDLADLEDDDSVFPLNFESDGKQILPFFSSEDLATKFLRAAFKGDPSVFQPYELLAGFVTAPQNDAFELILDMGSSSQRTITNDERRLIRKLARPATG